MACERLDRAERAGHVDVEDPLPRIDAHLRQQRVGIRGGIVDEDVDRVEPVDGGGERLCGPVGVGDVPHGGHHARVVGEAVVGVEVEDRNACACREQRVRDPAADPVRPAGDEGGAALELGR